jgi:probable HAF family extracellular repeat protein
MKIVATLAIATTMFVFGVMFSAESYEAVNSSRSFIALGDLEGGAMHGAARAVSADGSVVVGYSISDIGMQAFRWTRAQGLEALPLVDATAVTADGEKIVGYRNVDFRSEPVCWTAAGGVESLDPQGHYRRASANGVSANGATIVGVAGSKRDPGFADHAFRWTPGDELLLPIDGQVRDCSEAQAISADGTVVVGALRGRTGHNEAVCWSQDSGPSRLGFLPGHTTSIAYGVSADGSVIVGCSSDFVLTKAFRWTRETGMTSLETLVGSDGESAAFGCSADGSTIVGSSDSESGSAAIVWDTTHRVRSIQALLKRDTRLAPALRDWKLRSATAISADGSTVVGYGTNPNGNQEAWRATLVATSRAGSNHHSCSASTSGGSNVNNLERDSAGRSVN